jgi:hypothetical protein
MGRKEINGPLPFFREEHGEPFAGSLLSIRIRIRIHNPIRVDVHVCRTRV